MLKDWFQKNKSQTDYLIWNFMNIYNNPIDSQTVIKTKQMIKKHEIDYIHVMIKKENKNEDEYNCKLSVGDRIRLVEKR